MFSFLYKKASELKGMSVIKGVTLTDLKKKFEILIIDDNDFPFLDILRKHEYNITQKYDLTELKDASDYQIILCDIRGVGKFLRSEYEGAYLIKQLKQKYPKKTIIAYTANDYDANFKEYLDYADDTVPKGTYGVEEWTSLLDRLLTDVIDPVKLWEQTRDALLKAGIPTIEVAKYESKYVKAVKKGNFAGLKKLCEQEAGQGAEIVLALLKAITAVANLFGGMKL